MLSVRALRGLLFLPLLPIAVTLLGCQRRAAAPPEVPPPKVTVAKPVQKEVADYRDYTGHLEAVETVEVRARVKGFLEKVHFKEGAEVKKGDVLYDIDPRTFQAEVRKAEADLAAKEAQVKLAQSEVARAAKQRLTNAISEEEYVQRQATEATSAAAREQARAALEAARLELGFTKVTSPIDGRVSRTLVTPGNLVGANEATLLTTVTRLDPLYVYFDAPERDYLDYQEMRKKQEALPTAAEAKAPVNVGLETEQGHPHQGVLEFRETRVDPGTGTITLRGTLPNPDRVLTPGLFARVRVPFGLPEPRLLVPETAISADQRGRFVYVIRPDNTAEYRKVEVGRNYGGLMLIQKGLKPDDSVVVNGIQRIRPGAKVDPVRPGEGGDGTPDGKVGTGASPPAHGAVPPANNSPQGSTK